MEEKNTQFELGQVIGEVNQLAKRFDSFGNDLEKIASKFEIMSDKINSSVLPFVIGVNKEIKRIDEDIIILKKKTGMVTKIKFIATGVIGTLSLVWIILKEALNFYKDGK